MYNKLNISVGLVRTSEAILAAERLILPGVGAFDHGMAALVERDLAAPIRAAVAQGTPILGICLGMQLLGEGSAEGNAPGLGLIKGRCVRFQSSSDTPIKVPHMGWNSLILRKSCPLFEVELTDRRFYFTHSYRFVGEVDDVIATSTHGVEFAAVVQRLNVFGVQFHPEKSHRFGMQLLRSFGAILC
jgi:glutamine amidotransferase